MNTSSSHEALIKAAEVIRKLNDGLSSADFSLTILEKDLLKKQCQELYECLLALETNDGEAKVGTPEVQQNTHEVETPPVIPQITEEVTVEPVAVPEPEIQNNPEPEIPAVLPVKPLFQPEPEMEIEEVEDEAVVVVEQNTDDERQLSLLNVVEEADVEEEEEVLSEISLPTQEVTSPVAEPEPENPTVVSNSPEEVEEEELTLNEKISKTAEKKSFLDQMMLTPIDNIKAHITLNKKVAFIIGLFNQESEDYNKAIDQLNTADNLQAALDIYHMLKTRYGWNPEQDLVKELEMLVRRRFSSGV